MDIYSYNTNKKITLQFLVNIVGLWTHLTTQTLNLSDYWPTTSEYFVGLLTRQTIFCRTIDTSDYRHVPEPDDTPKKTWWDKMTSSTSTSQTQTPATPYQCTRALYSHAPHGFVSSGNMHVEKAKGKLNWRQRKQRTLSLQNWLGWRHTAKTIYHLGSTRIQNTLHFI